MEHQRVSTRKPPSLALCIVVPLVIMLVGAAIGGMFAVKTIPELVRENGRGLIPPGFEVELDEPGSYTVWIYSYATRDGVGYEAGEGLPPGAQLLVQDSAGRSLDVMKFGRSEKSSNGESAVAAGTFDLGRADQISVKATGFPTPTVVSVAPVKMASVFRFAITVVSILAGAFILAMIALFLLLNRRKAIIETL